ncbi:leucine-rich repeat protein kinase family protein, partial [Tanacetum coccineum]
VTTQSRIAQGTPNVDPNSVNATQNGLIKGSSLQCLVSVMKSLVDWEKLRRESKQNEEQKSRKILQVQNLKETLRKSKLISLPWKRQYLSLDHIKLYMILPLHFHAILMLSSNINKLHFNCHHVKGIEFLKSSSLVENTPLSVAKFLSYTPNLDKAMIGGYLGQYEEFPLVVMHAYADFMNLAEMKFHTAIREFLRGTKNKDMLAGSSMKSEKIEMVKEDHVIDMTKVNASSFQTPILPPQPSLERVVVKPLVGPSTTSRRTLRKVNSTKFFLIASLQEYTDSFSQENLVGNGMLATVYKAELPNRKQLVIKKLDDATSQKWNDECFIELVANVSKLQNENIVTLKGYCLEHGQRLFVFEYHENGTLHEALHLNESFHGIHEYLHEVCQPVVSDCGLVPLLPSCNISQLQSSGYGALELKLGSYTYQSDV